MVNDNARHDWRGSGKQDINSGADFTEQTDQRQRAEVSKESSVRRGGHVLINHLVHSRCCFGPVGVR